MPREFKLPGPHKLIWNVLDLGNRQFRGIIGQNVLQQLNITLALGEGYLLINNNKLYFNYACPEEINHSEELVEDNNWEKLFEGLNQEESAALKKILKENKDLFYKEGTNLSCTTKTYHQIITKSNKPIYSRTYRLPQVHEREVEKQIKEMLKQGIIQHSTSPYNSPIWVVPKKVDSSGEQKWRLVNDYRPLNEQTIDDKHPIPNVQGIFDKLGRATHFTTFDLAKGFYQILVDPKDRHKTAFSTPSGHYEYIRMPFGLKNAPATFQRLMNEVLSGLVGVICIVFYDDILVFGSSLQEIIVNMLRVLQRLREYNLKLQIHKCKFFAKSTEYLGHILSKEGIKPNPDKVECIRKLKIPDTAKKIKSFLGLTGFYRKFIQNYAKIATPLTDALKKGNKINVDDPKYIPAFEKLKQLITNYPTLRYPDFHKMFTLTTDASDKAIGAVLSQEGHPISFASRTLNEHERHYSTIEKELLSIVWSTQYFRPYLYGVKFLIKTDHRPLVWLNNLKEPNSKLQRWKIKLNDYNYDIQYVKGKENHVADFLSRIDNTKNEIYITEEEENTSNVATIHSGIEERLDYISIKEGIVNIYRTQILIVEQKVKEFELLNGKRKIYIDKNDIENDYFVTDILRRHLPEKGTVGIHSELSDHEYNIVQLQIVELYSNNRNLKFIKCTSKAIDLINEEQCYGKIKEIHEKGNHRGIQENFEEIKHLYYYKKIIQLITKYINNCEVCNLAKYDRNPVKVEFKLTETPNDINQIVHLDVFLIGKRMFFTGVDKFSKHMYTKELTDKNAITFIQYIRERNSCLGKPRKLVADNEFNMVNVKEFLRQESIEIHFTSPKSHTGNSDISRAHSSLLEHIRTLTLTERDMSISEKVLKATEFYNTTIHSTINCKPLDVQLGQVDKSKIAQLMQKKKEKWVSYCNKNREQQQNITHDKVYIKNYVNERYKEEPKYRKARVRNEGGNIVHVKNNRFSNKIHPTRITRVKKYFLGPKDEDLPQRKSNTLPTRNNHRSASN